MFALKITDPSRYGFPEVRRVVMVKTKSQRDKLVEFVDKNQREWAEFRAKYPHEIVPTYFCWYPGAHAEPLSMAEARREVADGYDEPYETERAGRWFNYVPWCRLYERKVYAYEMTA